MLPQVIVLMQLNKEAAHYPMKICIAHLSDIHFKTTDDVVFDRASKIAEAINATSLNPDALLLAFTGDIAFSGKTSQYEIAAEFISQIRKRCSFPQVFEFYIPGNHDLNFEKQPDTRAILLESIPSKIETIDLKGDIVKQLVSVQSEFFEFQAGVTSGKLLDSSQQLFNSIVWHINGGALRVNCLNTAWMSQNPEVAGKIVFPVHAVSEDKQPSELTITALHHPYNWLAPDNKRRLQEIIESLSDVVLTGHEHESDVYLRVADTGVTHYIEGSVLQDHDSQYSAFIAW
jgi:predicted MPP superfamily phosphohydrolase